MASGKKSFILYTDLIHTVGKLPDDKAGLLFKHILSYVNDEEPVTDDAIVEIAFEPIKQQFKRDLSKWRDTVEKRSFAGKVSADKRKQNQHMLTHVEPVQEKSKEPPEINHDLFPNIKTPIEQFFIDMTCGETINRISIVTKVEVPALLIKLEEFKSFAKLEYINYAEFADHFKNWILKKQKELTTNKTITHETATTAKIEPGKKFGGF